MALLIEKVSAILLIVLGLSHLLHPNLWSLFFVKLHSTGVSSLIIMMYTLPAALFIVVGHQVWSGISMLLTIIGWILLFKCCVYILIPSTARKPIQHTAQHQYGLRTVGLIMILVGIALIYPAFIK